MKIKTETISLMALFVYLVMFLNPDIASNNFLYYFPYFLCAFCLVLRKVENPSVSMSNAYIIWRLVLIIWCIISWKIISSDQSIAFLYVKLYILHSLVIFLVVDIYPNIGFEKIVKAYLYAVLITVIYILFHIDYGALLSFRLGRDVLGEKWNANSVGLLAAYSFLLMKIAEKRNDGYLFNKWLRGVFVAFLIVMIILSGSRKAIIVFALGWFGLYTINSKNRKQTIQRGIVAISALGVAYALIMYIPQLYEIVGKRLISMFAYANSGEILDASMRWRSTMIEYAWMFFRKKPIIGYGINGYRIEFGKYFPNYVTYAHNNFLELLVDGGVVVFALYYSIVPVMWKKFRTSIPKSRYDIIFMFLLIIVMDYAMVSYISFETQLYIALLYLGLRNGVNEVARQK